ncbi:hypothetical protein H1V43_32090 [Streptomyces sp. PSKA54]|uniref:Uncharacterized protein n=1 Tax=Streptomyces himalayensis subsp. aureolus TaxID=2758039 RepID=A0A7W2HJ94_9ACTN|nr:hypothetical protein [Streptomyces himalayensis]MBA4865905.1 hypothetical protein [Streptomyces himalayensis subsp. aureolus]
MAKYPSTPAGSRITGNLLQSMLPDIVYKNTNEDRSSTTTLTADSELTVALEANSVYLIDMQIHYATMSVAGFKTDWSVPSGTTGNRSALGAGSNGVNSTADNIDGRFGVHNYPTVVIYGDRDSSTAQLVAIERSILTTSTTAGNLTLRWAQETSNAAATRVGAGSFIIAWRLS